jgi:hypothetical protein
VEPVEDGLWNLYVSLRDAEGRARIGRTRLLLGPPPQILPLDPDPILDLGEVGTFDDSGVVTSCLLAEGHRRYLLYTGWSLGRTVPFYLAAGVAVSESAGPFRRRSRAPALGRSDSEPFGTASPFVLCERDRWRMWYVAGTGWTRAGSKPEPRYDIRYAESADGLTWDRSHGVCLAHAADEHAFGRPWIVRDADRYRMWFAVRGHRYRIESAESPDGITWTRTGALGGLLPAAEGWDSEMTEYPCVLDHQGRRYMLYNGNDYGRTGLGLAVWEPDSAPTTSLTGHTRPPR